MPKNYKNSWKFYLLIKRYNFHTCVYYQKMKSSIFPRFCSLHRTYPNIFTIFGPAYNFLHKFKHKALLNRKGKKENNLKPGEAQPNGPQAGPHGRCARALPLHAVTDGRVPLVRPSFFLSLRDADGEVPLVLAHARACSSLASPSRTYCQHQNVLYSLPSTSATRMAGGRHSRPRTGH